MKEKNKAPKVLGISPEEAHRQRTSCMLAYGLNPNSPEDVKKYQELIFRNLESSARRERKNQKDREAHRTDVYYVSFRND